MDNVPKEIHVVSVMTSKTLETEDKVRDEKDDRPSSASRSKAKQTDGEGPKSSQGSGSEQENSMDKSEIPCKNPSCKFWHPPVCLNYKSEKDAISDMLRHQESPTRSRRKVVRKDQLRY